MQFTKLQDPQVRMFMVGKVNAVQNNKSTLSDPDGHVYSLQPDGVTFEDRPAGASGAFEQCDVDGQCATYWYDFNGKRVGPVTVSFVRVTKAGS